MVSSIKKDNKYYAKKFGKTFSIYREMVGSLNIWDTSAVGRIEWVPGYVS